MINYIIKFLKTNKTSIVFNKEYRAGYNKAWINNIRDYSP